MTRPGRPLFEDLSLTVSSGDRVGVVGLNGTGKSTLLSVLTGDVDPESGTVRRGRDVRIAALTQRPTLPPGPVLAAVEGHAEQAWEAAAVLDHLGMAELAERRHRAASRAVRPSGSPWPAPWWPTATCWCSTSPPTTSTSTPSPGSRSASASYRGGLVLVTHDRHLLDAVTTRVLELDRGRGYVHEGGYDAYLEGRALREEQAASAEATRRILARKELAWLRRGAPARTRKPKARIEAATAVVEGRPEDRGPPGDPRSPLRHAPARRQGGGAPRRRLRPPRRSPPLFDGVELLARQPGAPRAGRPQRRREVHPPRPRGRSSPPDLRGSSRSDRPPGSATTTRSG